MAGHPLDEFTVDPGAQIGIAAQIRDFIALLVADRVLEPGDRMPPLRDLAGRLGVHVNTLRAAYAQLEAEGVLQTRHGIGTTIGEVEPDQLAAVTWRGGSNSIGVLIAGLDPFYLPLLRAVEDAVAQRGTLVVFADGRDSPTHAAHAVRQLVSRGVDGLIAVSLGELPSTTRAPTDRLPPIVYVDQPGRRGHTILFDTEQAGETVTRHLVAEGRRRIALLAVPDVVANLAGLRTGYERALEAERTGQSPWLVPVEGFAADHARAAVTALLDGPERPDAIIAASGTHALVVLAEARSRGINVPHDLAVTGYGDTEAAQLTEPPLSMIDLPTHQAGTLAAQRLQDLIAGREPRPRRRVLPTRLIVRASCGPHP
jgi:LacI family transcriptional regulator